MIYPVYADDIFVEANIKCNMIEGSIKKSGRVEIHFFIHKGKEREVVSRVIVDASSAVTIGQHLQMIGNNLVKQIDDPNIPKELLTKMKEEKKERLDYVG